jgi:hypothetical protein
MIESIPNNQENNEVDESVASEEILGDDIVLADDITDPDFTSMDTEILNNIAREVKANPEFSELYISLKDKLIQEKASQTGDAPEDTNISRRKILAEMVKVLSPEMDGSERQEQLIERKKKFIKIVDEAK